MFSRQTHQGCVLLIFVFIVFPALGQEKNQSYVPLAPELINHALTTISGTQLKLADYHDRVIVINIFATWSHPALLNLKELIKLKKHYQNKIEIIALASDKNEKSQQSVREFAHIVGINFHVVWESGDFAASLVKLVNVPMAIPQTFVIDAQGRIRKHFLGYNQYSTDPLMRAAVKELSLEQGKAATSR